MTDAEFRKKRRQIYLDQLSYSSTVKTITSELNERNENFSRSDYLTPEGRITNRDLAASCRLELFQLAYTAGEDLTVLAESLTSIVQDYEQYAKELLKLSDNDYYPPFRLNDMIDSYVDYLHLLSAAILLHREDLIPRIHAFNEGTDFDGVDAVIEELLKFYLPDRPELDDWLWDKPYRGLLDAIDADTPLEMAKDMKKFVRNWYPSMKGVAHFWGAHEKIKPEFSPYFGYWAMCAAAFSYLYDIDDSSYRDEVVYPKDLVDYARSKPRRTVAEAEKLVPLELRRCEGGKVCPETGLWFTPAKTGSEQIFRKGDTMPIFNTDYGTTIWYWVNGQMRHM
jgi:Domain of unknown function (DUF1911)